ncbi:Essential protein Yae1, N terminal [Neurospora sp. IMI 360204]|nr:Essential protein Yae1, N terminal [Neurospora sp. IMI 360204]
MLMRQISSKEFPELFTTMSSSGGVTNGIANNAGAGVAPTAPAVEYHNPTDDTTLSNVDNNNTTLDDVWGDGDDSHSHSHDHHHHHHHHHESTARSRGHGGHHHPSDVPRLQQEHTTAGYRDGITVAKAEHVQAGFDEGFGLGATIGAVAGQLLGVLEGLSFAVVSSAKGRPQQDHEEEEEEDIREKVKKLLAEAEKDLSVQSIYGKEYWDEDGTWRYEVPGESKAQHERYQHPERVEQQQQRQRQGNQEDTEKKEGQEEEEEEEEEAEILFPDVALAHPLIKKWDQIIRRELAERFGLVWDVAVLLPRSEEDEHEEGHEHGHVVKGSEEQKDAKPVRATSQALAW